MIIFHFAGNPLLAPPPRGSRREARLREAVSSALGAPIRIDDKVDYEDWTEQAARIAAVLESGQRAIVEANRDFAGCEIPGKDGPDLAFGRFPLRPSAAARPLLVEPVSPNRYAELESFRRNAGRRLVLCNMPGDAYGATEDIRLAGTGQGAELYDAIPQFAGRTMVYKQTRPAKAFPVLRADVPPGADRDWAQSWFSREVGLHMCRFEGDRDCILLQDQVMMRHETRFLIVDGQVVTGAPCVISDTPAERNPELVEGVTFARYEDAGGYAFLDRDIARRLEGFAARVAAEIQAECPELAHYTLDLAMGEEAPLVVELNPDLNSGLYANDAGAILRAHLALAARRERQPVMEV